MANSLVATKLLPPWAHRPAIARPQLVARLRAGLAGDHLRVIAPRETRAEDLRAQLEGQGLAVQAVQPGEPGLEDVFVQLAREAQT